MKLKHTIGSLERQIGTFVKTVQSLQHDTNLLNDQNDKYYERIQELEERIKAERNAHYSDLEKAKAQQEVLKNSLDACREIRKYIAFVLTGDEAADVQVAADNIKAQRDELVEACKDVLERLELSSPKMMTPIRLLRLIVGKTAGVAQEKIRQEALHE